MKRIKFILVIVLILLLTGCKIPEEEVEEKFDPELVEVEIHSDGLLIQNEENVSAVTFSISHNQPKYPPTKIAWTRNLIPVGESETFTYTPVSGLSSKTEVFATVTFTVDEVEHEYKTDVVTIRVVGKSAEIEIRTDHANLEGAVIDNIIKRDAPPIELEAFLSGDYGPEYLTWWVVDEDTKLEVELVEFRGIKKIQYAPTRSGLERVEARIEGKKFISNKIFIQTSYGKLTLSERVVGNQLEIISSFNNELEGVYSWEELTQSKTTYELVADANQNYLTINLDELIEPKLIKAKFTPSNGSDPIQSEPILVAAHAVIVNTEAELIQALADGAKVIKLGKDILYTAVDTKETRNPLVIRKPVTILGDGHKLESMGIFSFIQVSSNNVWFKDIKIDYSSRYNVVVGSSNANLYSYFENVEFIRAGGGSDMLNPGAGIYAMGSRVTVKNIKISESTNSGIRVDAIYNKATGEVIQASNVEILGSFEYDTKELIAPIISATSKAADATITAVGFDEFIIPTGSGKMIRRWSNDAYGVKWQLQLPVKVQYHPGENMNFLGITINVRIGATETTTFGLDFVYLFLDYFKNENGTIRVTEIDQIDNPISEYIIYDYDRSKGATGDLLLYQDEEGNPVEPKLPEELGEYQVHIWVGNTEEGEGLYLGYVLIRVIPEDVETEN